MKSLLALLVFASAVPALAEDTHCPQYHCQAAARVDGYDIVGIARDAFTLEQAESEALADCAYQGGGTRCRIVSCEYTPKLNVWGACIDAGSGLFNNIGRW